MAGIGLGDALQGARDLYGRAMDRVWGDTPSLGAQLATAFPQPLDAGRPGQSVAQAAPPPTSLTPQQWGAVDRLNFAGIFGGEGAATADLGALARAKEMQAAGHDPRAIHAGTGWFQGPEGRWKFEIDDSGAKIVQPSIPKFGRSHPAPQVLDHPDLYAAYPDLASVPFRLEKGAGSGRLFPGSGPDNPAAVQVEAPNAATARSLGLHEMQHAVQFPEGFEFGGSKAGVVISNETRPAFMQIYRDTVNRVLDPGMIEDFARDGGHESPEAAAADYAEHVKRLKGYAKKGLPPFIDKAAQETAQREAYRRLAGEAEARAVQARADMTPEQRRASFPLDSYDVPPDQLILRGIGLGR